MERDAQLPQAQLEIMQALWEAGGRMMFSDLSAALERRGKGWKANTVLTLLARLAQRGMVRVEKRGRLNEYVALQSAEAYRAEQTRQFVDKVYGGDVRHLVSALLRQGSLPPEDAEALRRFWQEGGAEE